MHIKGCFQLVNPIPPGMYRKPLLCKAELVFSYSTRYYPHPKLVPSVVVEVSPNLSPQIQHSLKRRASEKLHRHGEASPPNDHRTINGEINKASTTSDDGDKGLHLSNIRQHSTFNMLAITLE